MEIIINESGIDDVFQSMYDETNRDNKSGSWNDKLDLEV